MVFACLLASIDFLRFFFFLKKKVNVHRLRIWLRHVAAAFYCSEMSNIENLHSFVMKYKNLAAETPYLKGKIHNNSFNYDYSFHINVNYMLFQYNLNNMSYLPKLIHYLL